MEFYMYKICSKFTLANCFGQLEMVNSVFNRITIFSPVPLVDAKKI